MTVLGIDAKNPTNETNRKQFMLCSECHQKAVEKRLNRLGLLCCIGAWWICFLGIYFCLALRGDFCNNCYKEKFLMKAHETRRLQLYMDDHSLCEAPTGTIQKVQKRLYIIQPK
ncbi:hypothetical protein RB195_018699 [Necator americanus]|uniref:LITAF domain-containing protein n=1 Tax=Necator americanus TaxID=51031 RepID=A0ABR1CAX7_NECAM